MFRLTDSQANIFGARLDRNDGAQCYGCQHLRTKELNSNCVARRISPELILHAALQQGVTCYAFMSIFMNNTNDIPLLS